MGAYNHAIITTAGQSLSAQAIALGKDLTFTNVQASSHVYPAGTSLEALTSLQDVEQTEQISSAVVTNNTQIKVSARLTNEQVQTGYAINTIGILAKLDGDQTDTLFAVITAISADAMPAYSAANPVALIYDVTLAISNAESISVVVDPTGTVSVADLQNVANGVRDTAAHNLAPEYDATADYAVGDYCTHAGVLYRCTTAITGGETWTSGHWTQTDVKSEFATDADLTASFNTAAHNLAAEYDSTSTYAVGDYCTHDGTLYKCSTAINTAEAWDATHWTQTTVEAAIADSDKFFVVTASPGSDSDTLTANKTYDEIFSAINAQKVGILLYESYLITPLGYKYGFIIYPSGWSGSTLYAVMTEPYVSGTGNDTVGRVSVVYQCSSGTTWTKARDIYAFSGSSIASTYDSASTYKVGDYATHNGVLYKCNTNTSSPAGNWDTFIWDAVSAINETAHATDLAAAYSASATYSVGDYCTYNGVLYKCSTAITVAEAWNSAHWTAVTVTDEMGGGGESDFFVVEVTTDWWSDPPSTTANCTWAELTATTKPILWENQIVQVFQGMSGGRIAYIIPYEQYGTIVPSAYTVRELVFGASGNTVTANGYTTDMTLTQFVAPPYLDSMTYNVGDLVIYNNALYQCTTAVSAPESFDPLKWNPTTLAAVIAAL